MPKGFDLKISVLDESQHRLPLKRNEIKQALTRALRAAGIPGLPYEISLYFIDDDEMRRLNEIHRGLGRTTDVLSFPQFESREDIKPGPGGYALLGDIVISVQTLLRRCEDRGDNPGRELLRLLVHGALHLVGYDHASRSQRAHMSQLEESIVDTISR